MVDIPSDVSLAGSVPGKGAHRVAVERAGGEPHEKPSHHNGHITYIDGRMGSRVEKDDDDDDDLDALIEELESLDPDAEIEAELETVAGARPVPDELLQTDTRVGLVEPEVVARRKKYGLNQMKEEKENLFLKFLGYFVGPIQFVMEVCDEGRTRC